MSIRPLDANSLFLDEKRRHEAAVMKIFEQILSGRECFELPPPGRRNAVKEALDILKNASEDCRGDVVRTLAEILSMCVEENWEIESFRETLSEFISDKLDGDSERVFGGDEALRDAGTLFGSIVGIELPLTARSRGWRGMAKVFDECADSLLRRDSNPGIVKPASSVFFDAAREFLMSSPSFSSNFSSSRLSKAGTWEDALLPLAANVEGTGAIAALLLEGGKQKEFLEDLSMRIEKKRGRTKRGIAAPPEQMENSDSKKAILCILRSATDIPDHVRLELLSHVAGERTFATFLSEGVLRVSDIPLLDEYFGTESGGGHTFGKLCWGDEILHASANGEPFLKLFLRHASVIDADLASEILGSSLSETISEFIDNVKEAERRGQTTDALVLEWVSAAEDVLTALVAKVAERDEERDAEMNEETPVL